MRSLAVDHGSNRCGWSIFEDGCYVHSGFWNFSTIQHPQVLLEFHTQLAHRFAISRSNLLVIEQQVDVQNHHSTAVLHHMNAIEFLFCLTNNVPFTKFNPPEWRKLIGYSKAEKLEVAYAMADMYSLDVDKIAVPVRYKVGPKKGQVKEHLCDESDAIAINSAYWRSLNVRRG